MVGLARRLVIYSISGVAVVGAILTAVVLLHAGGPMPLIPSRCTVGLAGAAVSITADGVGADEMCAGWAGQTTNGGTWYRYTAGEEPGGAVICQGGQGDATITVRDQGILDSYGLGVCKNLGLVR